VRASVKRIATRTTQIAVASVLGILGILGIAQSNGLGDVAISAGFLVTATLVAGWRPSGWKESSGRRISWVILAGAAGMALLGAFPPWVLRATWSSSPPWVPGPSLSTHEQPAGLHFILTPPPVDGAWYPFLDYGRLLVSWSVVGFLTVAAALAVRHRPDQPGDTAHPRPPRPSGTVE